MSRPGQTLPPRPDLRVTVTSSTSLHVTWGSTMDLGDITYRVITASTKDPGSSLECRRLEEEHNSCQLSNLTPQAQYNITVVGCLRGGVCGPPSSLLISTPLSGASPFTILMVVFVLFVFLSCIIGKMDVLMAMLRQLFKGQSKQSMEPARELQREGIALTQASYDNPCFASALAEESTHMTSQSAYPTNNTNPQVNETTSTAYGATHAMNESAFPVYRASSKSSGTPPMVVGTLPMASKASPIISGASSSMSEAFPTMNEASPAVSTMPPATSREFPTMNRPSKTYRAFPAVSRIPPATSGESPTISGAPLLNESNSPGTTTTPRPTANDDPPTYDMGTRFRSSYCTGSIQVEVHRVEEK